MHGLSVLCARGIQRRQTAPPGPLTKRDPIRVLVSARSGHSPAPPCAALIADLNVRIIKRDTGELLRELTFNPARDYQA